MGVTFTFNLVSGSPKETGNYWIVQGGATPSGKDRNTRLETVSEGAYYFLVLIHQTIALILSLALSPATSSGLICTINCNYPALMKHASDGDQATTAMQHSHHHHGTTMNSACCLTRARLLNSSCVRDVQFSSAVEARWRVNFDSVAIARAPVVSARGGYSETAFLLSSPPGSFLKSLAPTLRI